MNNNISLISQKCCNCGCTEDLSIHYIINPELGGTNKLSNTAILCDKCSKILDKKPFEKKNSIIQHSKASIINKNSKEKKTINNLPADFPEIYNKMKNSSITKVYAEKYYGISQGTLYRWIKVYEAGI